jgi:hypothetical protein
MLWEINSWGSVKYIKSGLVLHNWIGWVSEWVSQLITEFKINVKLDLTYFTNPQLLISHSMSYIAFSISILSTTVGIIIIILKEKWKDGLFMIY